MNSPTVRIASKNRLDEYEDKYLEDRSVFICDYNIKMPLSLPAKLSSYQKIQSREVEQAAFRFLNEGLRPRQSYKLN